MSAASFGSGLCETFMYPYNLKVWAYPPSALGVGWMGERVAPVDLARILANLVHRKDDVSWGPNATFRFPLRGGTGAIWTSIASQLPFERISLGTRVAQMLDERGAGDILQSIPEAAVPRLSHP
jgi:protoporphyrinogen oxidase